MKFRVMTQPQANFQSVFVGTLTEKVKLSFFVTINTDRIIFMNFHPRQLSRHRCILVWSALRLLSGL